MFNLQSTCNYRLTKVYEWLIEELRCWIWVCELSVLDILSHRTIVSRACATASMTSSWAFESDYAECEVCSEQNNNNNNRRKPRSKTDPRSRFSHSLPPLEVASLQLHLKQPMFHFLPNSVLWACLYDCVLVERTHWSSGLPLFSFCAGSLRFRSGWRDLACSSSSSHSASTCLRFHFTCFRCVSFYCWPHCLIWRQIYRVRTTPSIVPVVSCYAWLGSTSWISYNIPNLDLLSSILNICYLCNYQNKPEPKLADVMLFHARHVWPQSDWMLGWVGRAVVGWDLHCCTAAHQFRVRTVPPRCLAFCRRFSLVGLEPPASTRSLLRSVISWCCELALFDARAFRAASSFWSS